MKHAAVFDRCNRYKVVSSLSLVFHRAQYGCLFSSPALSGPHFQDFQSTHVFCKQFPLPVEPSYFCEACSCIVRRGTLYQHTQQRTDCLGSCASRTTFYGELKISADAPRPAVADSLIHSRVALILAVRASLIGPLIIGASRRFDTTNDKYATNCPSPVHHAALADVAMVFASCRCSRRCSESSIYDPLTNTVRIRIIAECVC